MEFNVKWVETDSIRPYANNPRNNEAAVDAVAESISKFGWRQPIVVDCDGVIVVGHTRFLAARKLGLDSVPVHVMADATEDEIKAYRLADNKTNELAGWNDELLAQELLDISDVDMALFGFDIDSIVGDVDNSIVATNDIPENVETVCKFGDIWKLGNHRLMCGDSCSSECVDLLFDGSIADVMITDPPYNVNYEGGDINRMKIKNDNFADVSDFEKFLTDAFVCACDKMKNGASFYVWHSTSSTVEFINSLKAAGLDVHQCLMWVKSSFVLGRQDYQNQFEPCFYGWKHGAAHWFCSSRKERSVLLDDEFSPEAASREELENKYLEIINCIKTDVIRADKPVASHEHPTMKPVELIGKLIDNSSQNIGDVIYDPFGGSGTTLMCCEQRNRSCYMMELDEHYCDVIIARWEALTGQKAELIKNVNGD